MVSPPPLRHHFGSSAGCRCRCLWPLSLGLAVVVCSSLLRLPSLCFIHHGPGCIGRRLGDALPPISCLL
jgi:hypothetical protein